MVSFIAMGLARTKIFYFAPIIVGLGFLLIASRSDANEVWPAGTRLLIPERVVEEYQKESEAWRGVSAFFFTKYFVSGPSFREEWTDTFYLPFIKAQAGDAERVEVWMDIMAIRRDSNRRDAFKTTDDMIIVDAIICFGCKAELIGITIKN
ncbi:MAG: hypothetical protein OXF56_02850 [Rhodobacteraceae bacterium]|nr:hypothetical protein [Paracoccaceae bacterium]